MVWPRTVADSDSYHPMVILNTLLLGLGKINAVFGQTERYRRGSAVSLTSIIGRGIEKINGLSLDLKYKRRPIFTLEMQIVLKNRHPVSEAALNT